MTPAAPSVFTGCTTRLLNPPVLGFTLKLLRLRLLPLAANK